MFKTSTYNFIVGLSFLLVLTITSIASIFGFNSFITLFLLPIFSVLCFLNFGFSYSSKQYYFVCQILITISAIISTFLALNVDIALISLKKIVGVFLVCYLTSEINIRINIFNAVTKAYIFSTILLIFYEVVNGTISLTEFILNTDRDRFLLNANMYSYMIFFANISFLLWYERSKSKLLLLLYIISQYVFLVTVFSTASRSGLIFIVLVNSIYLIFINKSHFKFLNLIKIVILVFFSILLYLNYFVGSYLAERANSNSKIYDNSRSNLLYESLNAFFDFPFFGVGPNNFILISSDGNYSHISLLEISANQGIFGLIPLLILLIVPIFISFKWCLKTIDPELKIICLFFVCFFVYNFMYPFYLYLDLMIIFFLMCSQLNKKIKT